jgi:hypothetical protein
MPFSNVKSNGAGWTTGEMVANNLAMHNRSSKQKRPRDVNQLAKAIVDQATSEAAPEPETTNDGKNPAAVALGRLGGLKGGKARAAKLSKAKRSAIAKKAAAARWRERQS